MHTSIIAAQFIYIHLDWVSIRSLDASLRMSRFLLTST
jgi:hypothetical protein